MVEPSCLLKGASFQDCAIFWETKIPFSHQYFQVHSGRECWHLIRAPSMDQIVSLWTDWAL